MKIYRHLATLTGTVLIVSLFANIGVAPASAVFTIPEQSTQNKTPFDAEQNAAGLTFVDASSLDPGVAVRSEVNSTVVALGDFQFKITPAGAEVTVSVLKEILSNKSAGARSCYHMKIPSGRGLHKTSNKNCA